MAYNKKGVVFPEMLLCSLSYSVVNSLACFMKCCAFCFFFFFSVVLKCIMCQFCGHLLFFCFAYHVIVVLRYCPDVKHYYKLIGN